MGMGLIFPMNKLLSLQMWQVAELSNTIVFESESKLTWCGEKEVKSASRMDSEAVRNVVKQE
jgi:hypothetical protein